MKQIELKTILAILLMLNAGNLWAQRTVDELRAGLPEADELRFSMTAAMDNPSGEYMRVAIDTKDCVSEAGTYAFVLPFNLDGYYFGAVASRWNADNVKGNITEPMADLDDFQAGKLYVVEFTEPFSEILSYSPGIPTTFRDPAVEDAEPLPAYAEIVGSRYFIMPYEKFQEMMSTRIIDTFAESFEGKTYDLMGREVNESYRGIVVRNGQKTIRR